MGCCECESNLCITIHWDLPDSVIWLSESSLSFDSPLHATPPNTQGAKHVRIIFQYGVQLAADSKMEIWLLAVAHAGP